MGWDEAGRRGAVVNSLRVRLLATLLALLVVAALVMGALTYRSVLAETEALFDYQLRQMALSLRDQGEILPDQARDFANEELDFVVQIWSADGRSIYASRPHSALPARALLGLAQVTVAGQAWRTYSVATGDRVIQVAQPQQTRRRLAADAALRSVMPLLLLVPVLLLATWALASHALRPLADLTRRVRERDAVALDPLPEAGLPDELAPLVGSLNALLQRLGQALDAQRAFVADAAHELRSPLTALKLQLQVLRRSADPAARNEALAALGDGIERAARGIEQLLALARHEPGAPAVAMQRLDLAEVLRAALAEVRPYALARGTALEVDAGTPVAVQGDAAALAVLVRNLADNAVRYAPPGSRVVLRAALDGAQAVLTVDDAGPGIPPDERERVFDRFYRRAAGGEPGSGLGLAIVRGIAQRHGATVALGDSPLGGLRVCVRFAAA